MAPTKTMSLRVSTYASAGVAVLLFGLACPSEAAAQACCAGSTSLTPGRLERHEWLLVGMQARAAQVRGAFDAQADYAPAAAGTTQWDLEQRWFATLRVLKRGQAGAVLPSVQSYRDAPAAESEFGLGVGDLELALRWDFAYKGELAGWPGLALLVSSSLPTGRPPESAKLPLGSDATGTGYVELTGGVALDDDFGPWLFSLVGDVAYRFSRSFAGIESQLAMQCRGVASAGYVWTPYITSALIVSFAREGDTLIDDEAIPNTSRHRLNLAVAGSYSINNDWRVRASVFGTPSFGGLSQNELAELGLGATVIRSFW